MDFHMEEEVRRWIFTLCEAAGESGDFGKEFIEKLEKSPEIYKEFLFFAHRLEFCGAYKIKGYSVVDIMVWQINHFKAHLDRKNEGMADNRDKMVLRAFDTFLNMEKNPEQYIELLQNETGTDYPGKY